MVALKRSQTNFKKGSPYLFDADCFDTGQHSRLFHGLGGFLRSHWGLDTTCQIQRTKTLQNIFHTFRSEIKFRRTVVIRRNASATLVVLAQDMDRAKADYYSTPLYFTELINMMN